MSTFGKAAFAALGPLFLKNAWRRRYNKAEIPLGIYDKPYGGKQHTTLASAIKTQTDTEDVKMFWWALRKWFSEYKFEDKTLKPEILGQLSMVKERCANRLVLGLYHYGPVEAKAFSRYDFRNEISRRHNMAMCQERLDPLYDAINYSMFAYILAEESGLAEEACNALGMASFCLVSHAQLVASGAKIGAVEDGYHTSLK